MNFRDIPGFAFLAIFLLVGCKTAPQPDYLIGHWQVTNISRAGQSLVGPGFKGSHYIFTETGQVKAWDQGADTMKVDYTRNGDTLFWVTMDQNMFYLIDTLGPDILTLLLDQEGMKSEVEMRKVKTQ